MDLKKIISQGESETVEFKKSLSESKEITKTISAFANTIGMQLLGVSKSTLLRIFKSLEEKGLIKKGGKGKNIYYMLV